MSRSIPKARFNLPAGDKLVVYMTKGYVMLVLLSPGRSRFRTEIYIPWSVMLKLLPWWVKGAKRRGPDFYPPKAVARYLEAEAQFEREMKRQKREAELLKKQRRSANRMSKRSDRR